ncbi:MAG: DMT family transporter [Betaproteobacteria bacterium]
MTDTPVPLTPTPAQVRRGLMLGLLGVVIVAMTCPLTRLAVGDVSAPQMSPEFVTAARAALAGLLSIGYLRWVGARVPARQHWRPLAVCALGTVVGFPLCIGLALREVESMHAAVVTGIIPLGTAVVGALTLRQRPSAGFWACALAGFALVVSFAAWKGGGRLVAADGWLLLAVLSTSIAYVAGARVSGVIPAQQVICWVVVGSLPFTLPATVWWWPVDTSPSLAAWGGLLYVSLFSMWLGFFAWYGGLAMGGIVRVSQVQLIQPFLALLFGVPILGERLDPTTVAFSLAVIAVVFVSRRMAVGQPAGR